MKSRVIVKIDEARCNGCGECLPSCAEHALTLENGKVRIIEDKLCDGLGACLGACPHGALTLMEREAEPFDALAVEKARPALTHAPLDHPAILEKHLPARPAMKDWPLKLQLVPTKGMEGARLLLAADCAAALCQGLGRHSDGRRTLLACPKLESKEALVEKLARIFLEVQPESLEILRMEVPCCCLPDLVRKAQGQAMTSMPVSTAVISIHGQEEIKLQRKV